MHTNFAILYKFENFASFDLTFDTIYYKMSPVNKKLIANFSFDPEKTVNKIFHYDFCYFVKNGRGKSKKFPHKKK